MPFELNHQTTAKGPIVSNIELPVLRKHATDGNKRLRRVVPLITAGVLSASLIAGVAGPASAAVREPARSAPISLASSDNAQTAAASYVHLSDGRFTLDTRGAEQAGVSSQALSTEGIVVAGLNKLLDREPATTAASTRDGIVGGAEVASASTQGTTITLLPGITLTISNTGLQLSMTKPAVTEVTNVVGFVKDLTAIVATAIADNPVVVAAISAAMVAITGNPAAAVTGPIIAAAGVFVTAVIGLAADVLKICTASDGSATFTVPWFGLPSCSGLTLV